MKRFARPIVVVSKCIEFEPVRWNGQIVSSDFVRKLRPYVDFLPVCPEVEVGLGVPRDTLRIVSTDDGLKLIQPATNLDLTEKMLSFSHSFLNSLKAVDGFILKSGSPTSALKNARIYPNAEKSAPIARGPGIFGRLVLERFPNLAIEDERRLINPRIREHFLRKLFAIAGFRECKATESLREFVRFHSENKLLLNAYNQNEAGILGKTVANQENKPFAEIIRVYEQHLFETFRRPAGRGSNINVMMHIIGYFTKNLSKEERAFFLDSIEKYRSGKIRLSVSMNILKAWVVRFREDYLRNQTFFEPYPEELIDIGAMTTYCDRRDYWK